MKKQKIVTIKEEKKHFVIHFDNRETLDVLKETYFKFSLYEIEELDNEILNKIKFNDELIGCEISARKFLTGGSKSSNRLILSLQVKGFSEESINIIVEKLFKDETLNDIVFVQKFIKRKIKSNKISKNMLISLLINEGIDEELILKQIELFEINDYETAKKIVNKRYKGKVKEVEKIYNYLSSKGFEQDVIFAVLGKEI